MNFPEIEWLLISRLLLVVLLHFIWQATLVCLVVVVVRSAIHPRNFRARYATSVVGLLLIVVSTLATAGYYCVTDSAVARLVPVDLTASSMSMEPLESASMIEALESQFLAVFGWFDTHRALWLGVWLVGVLLLIGRLTWSLAFCIQLRRSRMPLPPHLERLALEVKAKLRLTRNIVVASSHKVSQAVATGIIKPVVLIPASWVTELPVSALEAVLAHELAHVKRWDLWINLLQRLTETVFFFHPLVWWLSRTISTEREICCDQLAIHATGKPMKYVETLAQVANGTSSENSEIQFGTAFNGGKNMKLLRRAKMILEPGSIDAGSPFRAFTLVLCVGMLVSLGSYAYCSFPEPAAAPVQEEDDEREILERIDLLVTDLELEEQENEEIHQLQELHLQFSTEDGTDRSAIARQLRRLADQLEAGDRHLPHGRIHLHEKGPREVRDRVRLREDIHPDRRRVRIHVRDQDQVDVELHPEVRAENVRRFQVDDNQDGPHRIFRLRDPDHRHRRIELHERQSDQGEERFMWKVEGRELELHEHQDDRERGDFRWELEDGELELHEFQGDVLGVEVENVKQKPQRRRVLDLRHWHDEEVEERNDGRRGVRLKIREFPGETSQDGLEETLRHLQNEMEQLRREVRELKSRKKTTSSEFRFGRPVQSRQEIRLDIARIQEVNSDRDLRLHRETENQDSGDRTDLSEIPLVARLMLNVSPRIVVDKLQNREEKPQPEGAKLDFQFKFEDEIEEQPKQRRRIRERRDPELAKVAESALHAWTFKAGETLLLDKVHDRSESDNVDSVHESVRAWVLGDDKEQDSDK